MFGKRIILFATSGGSGLGKADRDLAPCVSGTAVVNGRLLNGRPNAEDLASWASSVDG